MKQHRVTMWSEKNVEIQAPGWPGAEPRWTSSAKCGVGTSVQPTSGVWFSLGRGIVNEVYHPEVDHAAVRSIRLLVANGIDFFSDEADDTEQRNEPLADGVPAYRLTNECSHYRIEKEILTDPRLDVLLQRVRFFRKKQENLRLYVFLEPHLGDGGAHNTAWIGRMSDQPILFASGDKHALALACSAPFLRCSVGFVGVSDGRKDLQNHHRLTCEYTRAEDGNVALTAEIDFDKCDGEFVLALGFDLDPLGAANHARASLLDGFDAARNEYVHGWNDWQAKLKSIDQDEANNLYRVSTSVLKVHGAKRFPGALVASLSVPWGFARGDKDRGGYHVVWVRDLVEVAGALMSAGLGSEASRVLRYLAVTQKPDGSWPQNMWANGKPHWGGDQMDETAFPVLLTARAWREKIITDEELKNLWPMMRTALTCIVRNGPATNQDRWEELSGYSPFTLTIEIVALIEASELMQRYDRVLANYLRETADTWNESIERWTYATGTELARQFDVEGYYVRITPQRDDGAPLLEGVIPIKNHPGKKCVDAVNIVSPDMLALVNYGLRAADDPRIVNTVRVIDSLLKVELPNGPSWHRYNHDGYGERRDGAPFDGAGVGRAWPLLTGERAHYELARGGKGEARRLMRAMAAFAGEGGMIPEQVWDASDIPERGLFFGRPSGSAMPLVWAHAEYVKLCRSLQDGKVYGTSDIAVQRYLKEKQQSAFATWRFNDKIQSLPRGKNLRIEVHDSAVVHWTIDRWKHRAETVTSDSGLGVYHVDLTSRELREGAEFIFTFCWTASGCWEGKDFKIKL